MAHFKFSQHLIQNFWEIQCHFQKVYNQTEKPHTPKCRLTMFNDLRLKALHKWDQSSEKGGDHAFEIRKRQRLVMLLKVSLRTIHHQGVHGTSNTSNLTFFFFFFLFFSFVFFFLSFILGSYNQSWDFMHTTLVWFHDWACVTSIWSTWTSKHKLHVQHGC